MEAQSFWQSENKCSKLTYIHMYVPSFFVPAAPSFLSLSATPLQNILPVNIYASCPTLTLGEAKPNATGEQATGASSMLSPGDPPGDAAENSIPSMSLYCLVAWNLFVRFALSIKPTSFAASSRMHALRSCSVASEHGRGPRASLQSRGINAVTYSPHGTGNII